MQPLEAATDKLLSEGVTVFNGAMLASNESDHARRLLDLINPPEGALIVDAGCGVGAVAALMSEVRDDLQFVLVNNNQHQLDLCPKQFRAVLADFNCIPLSDGVADVVMFNYAISHSTDWSRTMREARRVLKAGGSLFIFDFARVSGDNTLMQRRLNAAVYSHEVVCEAAAMAGFSLEHAQVHDGTFNRLREVMGAAAFDVVVGDVVPMTWRFRRREQDTDEIAWAMSRHQRIGFQFSGGRDSTAALYLLRPYWNQMTFYHLDSGDQFPEIRQVVCRVERDLALAGIPLHRIDGHSQEVRRIFGMPSDILPADNHMSRPGVRGARSIKIQSRYECCTRVLMHPMHKRMIADGITLIVRGQRDQDYVKPPYRSGDVGEGFEFLYPIQSWTGDQVSEYLHQRGLPIADVYELGALRASDCIGCTAWWDEGRATYMRRRYPQEHAVLLRNLAEIRAEIDRQYQFLTGEMQ